MQGYYLGSFSRAEKQISREREKIEAEGTTKERRGKLSLQVTQRNSGTRLKISGVKQLLNRNVEIKMLNPQESRGDSTCSFSWPGRKMVVAPQVWAQDKGKKTTPLPYLPFHTPANVTSIFCRHGRK